MTDAPASTDRDPLVLAPREGRSYPMGRLSAVFKADGTETAGRWLPSARNWITTVTRWDIERPGRSLILPPNHR